MRSSRSSADGADAAADRFGTPSPAITLPSGGGAIRGIGEKFSANPVTGTGAMTVPLFTSPGRSGFGPALSLSYDSGAGNGPFGLGWSLVLPSITRKTEKGLPQYQDAVESDVFLLSGAEDLTPFLVESAGQWAPRALVRTVDGVPFRIQVYRPRVEGLFARIERWTALQSGEVHWRSITRDNVTSLYGRTEESRIADPTDPMRVFRWLICESYDANGNAIVYRYGAESAEGVDLSQAHEKNRSAAGRSANRYLTRVRYGNRTPRMPNEDLPQRADWLFEVVFDYDQGHYEPLPAGPDGRQLGKARVEATRAWSVRPDAFSSYRAGFEVRTYRLCRQVLMFHHFPDELGTDDYLVRSTVFAYREGGIASFITTITQSGHVRQDGDTYLTQSLPPLEFEYSEAEIHDEIHDVDADSLENSPYGVDGADYRWVDLDGEGLSGILTEQAGAWSYKRSLGGGRFAPLERVATMPSLAASSRSGQQLLDLAGDGQLDLVMFGGPTPGFHERTRDEDWEPFKPFRQLPNIAWDDPNLRFLDLNGDGHADVLITEDEVFTWHPSLAEVGFGAARQVRQAPNEEQGPRLVLADGTQSIHLADMCGDGLTDLVRIRSGEVCYWPNLGYGRFGAKVTMDHPPWFDHPDQLDQQRVRLADIDGSGVTDIIYLGRDGVRLYFNEAGNRWSDPRHLSRFPHVDNVSAVLTADLLGNGTACLVWSSPLPGESHRPMRYLDLMGGQKPHLLVRSVNNLGAETRLQYAPSTKFYLQDRLVGRPWITRLPFPVHVVERVETHDRISRNRFVTRYAYHHGYFDGDEREFRGFGMVEQWDTEEYAALSGKEEHPDTVNFDPSSHVPPVHTKSWFHTGAYLGRNHVSDFFAGLLDEHDTGEYYREPGLTDAQARAQLLADTVLPDGVSVDEAREACRALKGAMLRQEVYALDGTAKAEHPYAVTEQHFTIRVLQPRAGNRHAVYFTHAREAIDYHYERNPTDPRIQHALTLEVDDFGNVLKEAAIAYGRRHPDMDLSMEDRAKQMQALITYTERQVTNAIDTADDYRAPLPCETRTYELTGYTPTGPAGRFEGGDFVQPDPGDPGGVKRAHIFDGEIQYEDKAGSGAQRRLIEHVRMLYRKDDLSGRLPVGTVEPLALPAERYQLACTPGLLAQIYQRDGQPLLPSPADVLGGQGADRGAYVVSQSLKAAGSFPDTDADDHWWIASGRVFYSPGQNDLPAQELTYAQQHFFVPHRFSDPFGQTTTVAYDAYDLLPLEREDPLHNKVTAGERDAEGKLISHANDYRVLLPALVTDPNRNRSAVAFDAWGLVVGTAVMGKAGESQGDALDGFHADLDGASVRDQLQNPFTDPHAILQDATSRVVYDVHAYHRTRNEPAPQPAVVYSLVRETHRADLEPGQQTKIQHGFSYFDGFGRQIQTKIQAEPGPLEEGGADVVPRWVGSGWTVFNNKGKPVRQYEPFFTATHGFEFDVRVGVSPVLFYDPIERVVATLHPNHTWEKSILDPWRQQTWDVNDTALIPDPREDPDVGDFFRRLPAGDYLPTWHARRQNGALGAQEQAAATKTAVHAATPTIVHRDVLGRPVLTVAHNRFERDGALVDERFHTRVELDIEGNQRAVIDAKDRIVMRYDYDMLGNLVHQASMEAGERWMLDDVTGSPIRAWDSRGFARRMAYDVLRRPVALFVADENGERLAERTVYGEVQGDTLNHRGHAFQVFDSAGVVTSEAYDFKGNVLRTRRDLLPGYKDAVDWRQNPVANNGTFSIATRYDALNRPIESVAPDGSRILPRYNEASLLAQLDAHLRGASAATGFVSKIDYNAKGQRKRIEYGNGTLTEYRYDPDTFRMTSLATRRPAVNARLQALSYTYDPAGNIVHIHDDAQQTIYFSNAVVEPHADYVYDAVYRLIEAAGREHAGHADQPQTTWNDAFRVKLAHPHDGQALRRYAERYEYDPVGNFERLIHQATNGNWTRAHVHEEPSLLEPAKISNRLSRTTVGETVERYSVGAEGYDAHGNMLRMPHLPLMQWDDRDQLQATSRQSIGNGGTPEITYYVYDAGGQRIRKVTERQAASGQAPTRMKERIYLGGFEIYREYDGSGMTVTLERASLHVMDGQQRIAIAETKTIDDQTPAFEPLPVIRYQLGNHLGSASLELDVAGAVISYEEYFPYGSTSYQAGRGAAEVGLKRYRYTGKERDGGSGLYYHGARYYAAWLGRWVSADPAERPDGSNLYVYVRGSPVRLHDPDGRKATATPGTADYEIMARDDAALLGHLRTLSPEKLDSLRSGSTGLFRQRINAHIGKFKLEAYRVGTTRVERPHAERASPEDKPKPPAFGQPFSHEIVGEVVNFYVNKANEHDPVDWTHQLSKALGLIINERNYEAGRGKDLNYAAADHYLNARAVASEVGEQSLPGSAILIIGWDAVKAVTLPLGINPNFIDPGSDMPSDPDPRVRDWAFQGLSDGLDDFQRGKGDLLAPGRTSVPLSLVDQDARSRGVLGVEPCSPPSGQLCH
jgi:RHS repeat-associated protein